MRNSCSRSAPCGGPSASTPKRSAASRASWPRFRAPTLERSPGSGSASPAWLQTRHTRRARSKPPRRRFGTRGVAATQPARRRPAGLRVECGAAPEVRRSREGASRSRSDTGTLRSIPPGLARRARDREFAARRLAGGGGGVRGPSRRLSRTRQLAHGACDGRESRRVGTRSRPDATLHRDRPRTASELSRRRRSDELRQALSNLAGYLVASTTFRLRAQRPKSRSGNSRRASRTRPTLQARSSTWR